MIEEIRILGVYMPAALFWAVLALIIQFAFRAVLLRFSLRHFLWHPALIDLATFVLLWWGVMRLADAWFPHGFIS